MNERIVSLKANIQKLADAGIRRTEFYPLVAESLNATVGQPAQVRRAMAFAHLLDHAPLLVFPHELLAGSILGMWPVEHNLPDYAQRMADALGVIDRYVQGKRDGRAETAHQARWALMARDHYDANIPYEELQRLIAELTEELKDIPDLQGYEIGRVLERHFCFDYGAETRTLMEELPWEAANHLDYNFGKALRNGLGAILLDAQQRLEQAGSADQKEFYTAVKLCLEAAIRFIRRYAAKLSEEAAAPATDGVRAVELREISAVCARIASDRPETFREALQLVWMVHIIANITGGSALSFSRFDQYMYPFYRKDTEAGILTADEAAELLGCMWAKVNEPKMRTVQSLCLGGVTPQGGDAANGLTALCLDVCARMGYPYPNVSVRLHAGSPAWLLDQVVATIKTGCGNPMILNDAVWVPNFVRLGYPLEFARDYYNMGCVETMIQGRQPTWRGTRGINMPWLFQAVFENWEKGEYALDTFEEFMQAFLQELAREIKNCRRDADRRAEELKGKYFDPFASAMIDGCMENGLDLNQGGSTCPASWAVNCNGLGTAADSLSAVKKHIYDTKRFTLAEIVEALKSDFQGRDAMQVVLDRMTPCYGNDLAEADDIARRIFNTYGKLVSDLNDGSFSGKFVTVLFSYTTQVFNGEITLATANGRRRGQPFSDAIGPSQGKDMRGPTKLMNSVLKLDNTVLTGGFALNLKMTPGLLKGKQGSDALRALVSAYLKSGGAQVQFNIVGAETLKSALADPERYRNVVVRVAGYCEYFVNLDRKLQEEIILRTQHEAM